MRLGVERRNRQAFKSGRATRVASSGDQGLVRGMMPRWVLNSSGSWSTGPSCSESDVLTSDSGRSLGSQNVYGRSWADASRR